MPATPVSVVVPLYNKRESIAACVGSILSQEFEDFELLVVDDGSTDNSAAEIEALADSRMRIIRQSNQGRSAARNRGIAEARSTLVALLDADDTWGPGFLTAILELRAKYPDAGLYGTGICRCWSDGRDDLLISVRPDEGTTSKLISNYLELLSEGDFITSSNVAIPKQVFETVGGFQTNYSMGEDRDFWARIALVYPIACDSRVEACYRTAPQWQPPDSAANESIPPAVSSLLRAREERVLPAEVLDQIVRYTDRVLIEHADGLLWGGERAALRRFLAKAPFQGSAAKTYARWVGAAVPVMPMRVVSALRFKGRLLRRKYWGRQAPQSAGLWVRRAPCQHGVAGDGQRSAD